jgi:hypothetical protein
MVIDSPADLVPIAVLATAVLGGILWLIRAQNAIGKQFKPNGGASIRDSVDRIENDTRQLRDRLDRHIDDHNKR